MREVKEVIQKDIRQYIHLYLGCEVETPNGITTLVGVCQTESDSLMYRIQTRASERMHVVWYDHNEIKPILRPLSSMTEEECDKYGIAYLDGEYQKDCFEADAGYGPSYKVYSIGSLAERINDLRKAGFDCDRLIESNLAIEENKR